MTIRQAVLVGITIATALLVVTLLGFLLAYWLFNSGGSVPGTGEGDVFTGLGTP